MNLLIVDDHPTNLKLLRAQMESEGHAVFEAHDGLDALALLNRQRVDAVISDILMPRMDGYRLCHEIRMNERLHDLAIIIYTSTYTSPDDEKLALDVGADKYLKKPASVETLVAALHEVIAKPHDAPRRDALREVEVLKEYSERLVSKLEEKNTDLMASEVKFRTLVEQSIVGVYIVQDDQFVYVNPGMARIFGWSEKEMTSRTIYDFIVPEDHALVRENIRKWISGGEQNCHYYLRMLHQSGPVLQVEVHDSLTDYNGRPAMMGTLVDITERKRAEEAAQRSKKRLRDLIDGLGPSMFVGLMTPQGVLIEANRPALAAAGLKPEDVLGKPFEETYWWAYSQEVQQQLREAIARAVRGESSRYDVQLRMAKNHLIDVEFSLQPLRDETGEVVFLVPSANVITERKQAEEEVKFKNTILKTQQEISLDAILVVDENEQIISYNQQFIDLWRLPPQMVSARLDAPVLQAIVTQVENSEAFVARVQYLYEHRDEKSREEVPLKDGRIIDRYSAPVTGTDGKYYGRVWYFRDITERKTAEAKIQRLSNLYAALSQCNQAIVRCTGESQLFSQICRDVVTFGGVKMAWIGMLDEQRRQIVPVAAYGDGIGYLEGLAFPVDADNPLGGDPIATAVRENRPYWCQDFQNDPTTAFWHERGAQYGWGAAAVLPLHRNGVIVGTFTLYAGEANAFDQAERNLLEELAMIISFALDNFVREAGRKQAEVALRESEAVRCKHYANDTVDSKTPIAAYLHIAEQEFGLTADTLAEKRSNNQDDIFELGRQQPIRLLLVEDSDHDTQIITCLLCKDGINFQLRRVETEASFRQALQDPVDLVIFSAPVSEFSAVCALEILPSNIALIILSEAVGAEAEVGTMKRGAVEYVAKESIGTLPDAMKRVLKVATMHENQRLTQEKLANANVHLAKLSIQLIEIQEQERKNLAREMHDELGQRLTLLKISLHRMREFLGEPRALNTWETMDAEVTVLAAQIRAMSGSLRPQTLDYVGLESAVRQLLESSFSNTRISYIFEYVGLPSKIAAPIDITAYRIVQESVTNIVKHANATQVVVEINGGEAGEEMEIVVRDNGIGFDTARIKTMQLDSVSSGLLGLRERIVLLGGSIAVETSIGKGARLVVSLPMKGVINDKN